MREILFRGKRVDNGEWVYGYLSKSRLQGYENNTLQPSIDREESGVMITSVVIPETIGQYTGLNDKNGKRIFEGNIVKVTDDKRDAREFDINIGIGLVEFFNGFWCISEHIDNSLYDMKRCFGVEVIGNIHDNPELLEDSK